MSSLFKTLGLSGTGGIPAPPPICSCDPSSMCPCQCAGVSEGPVQYSNGDIQMAVADLPAGGFGLPWGHVRTYCNQLQVQSQVTIADFGNGFNWMTNQTAYLVNLNGDESEIQVAVSPQVTYWFSLVDSSYIGAYGAVQALYHDTANQTFRFVQTDGTVWTFFDFDQTADPAGMLSSVQAPGGQSSLTFSYPNATSPVSEVQRSYTDSDGVTTIESFLYTYLAAPDENAGDIATVTLQRNVGGAGWDLIRQAAFTYYQSGSTDGAPGDLQTASHQVPSGTGDWATFETYYYRYYLDFTGGTGFAHALKFVLQPESFRRLSLAVADPLSATDAQIAAFADFYFEYDNRQRVTLETIEAGTRTFQLAYTSSSNTQDYNYWQTKTIETRPDGSQNIVYTNHIGQMMLKSLVSGSDSWTEYWQYDETLARIILDARPSAVQGYNDTQPDLGGPSVIVNPTSGLVKLSSYYESTTATPTTPGGAQGYLESQSVQQGLNNSPIALSEVTYYQRNTTDDDPSAPLATIYPPAASTVYASDSNGGSDPIVTSFAYTWYAGTLQMQQKTTTLPVISTAENGSGVAGVQRMLFDQYGNMTWEQGPRNYVDNFTFDVTLGVKTTQIKDVDPPSGYGWPNPPTGTRLNLETDYTYDDLGRVTQQLGPRHPVNGVDARTASWTAYHDVLHQTWTAQGYVTGSPNYYRSTLVNPVTLTSLDYAGRPTDTIQAARATTDGPLSPSDCFPQSSWVAWSTNVYNDAGQKTASRAYHCIPASGVGLSGANYDETDYGYDIMDRGDMTTTPGGTITAKVFDPRGLVLGVYVGTNAPGATSSDPTGGDAKGNNMVQVTGNVYDGGAAGGDGNLTQRTDYVDAIGESNRVTTFIYDFRDRQIGVDGELEYYQVTMYDNLNRIIQVDRRNTTANGQLLARTLTFWDDRSRVYQTQVYSVNPSTGALGNSLVDNTWRDLADNIIKTLPAGAQTFTKKVYNSQARVTASYVGYYTGSGAEPYSDVGQVTSQNIIFEQAITTYDDANNAIETDSYQRFDSATGAGVLNPPYTGTQPLARVSYVANFPDGVGRMFASANYGTNNNVTFTAPATPPASSATVLVTSFAYDNAGNLNQTTDPAGIVSLQTFNALGKSLSMVSNYTGGCPGNATDVTIQFAYNCDGNMISLTAVNPTTGDQTTQFVYGTTLAQSSIASNELLSATIYPDSASGSDQVTQTFNRQGQVTGKTDQNGTVHQYLFDLLGRSTDDIIVVVGAGVDSSVQRIGKNYEIRGLVNQITSYADTAATTVVNQVQNAYNGFQQLTNQYQQHGSAVNTSTSPQVGYAYADGSANTTRLTAITYPGAINGSTPRAVTYNYASGNDDALSRVTNFVDSDSTTLVEYTYLGLNTFVDLTYPQPDVTWSLAGGSGANPYIGLDQFGRVINNPWTTPSATLDQIQYGYDQASNRLWRHQTVAAGNDELYSYDGLNRLTDMSRGNLTNNSQSIANMTLAQQWGLDATGNWSNFINTDVNTATNNLDQQRTSNPVNEIMGISQRYGLAWSQPEYNAAGNMTTIPRPAAPTSSFAAAYDAWNRLTQLAGVATYSYDGLNRRTQKTISGVVRDYYYSTGWQILEERDGGATVADRQFVWGQRYIDDLVLRDRTTERLYALQDANWNVTAVINTAGVTQERYSYTAYGTPTFLNSDFSVRSGGSIYFWETLYCGYRWDSESELYQIRNRYLSSLLGEWVTRDPSGFDGGDASFYAYVLSQPVNSIDSLGLNIVSQVIVPCTPGALAMATLGCADLGGLNPAKPPVCRITYLLGFIINKAVQAFCNNTGDCDQIEYRMLRAPVHSTCDQPRSCAKIMCNPMPGVICPECDEIRKRLGINNDCIAARMAIMNKCFKGGDQRHKDEVENVRKGSRCVRGEINDMQVLNCDFDNICVHLFDVFPSVAPTTVTEHSWGEYGETMRAFASHGSNWTCDVVFRNRWVLSFVNENAYRFLLPRFLRCSLTRDGIDPDIFGDLILDIERKTRLFPDIFSSEQRSWIIRALECLLARVKTEFDDAGQTQARIEIILKALKRL